MSAPIITPTPTHNLAETIRSLTAGRMKYATDHSCEHVTPWRSVFYVSSLRVVDAHGSERFRVTVESIS